MRVSQNWMSCALISPLTILVSPIYLINPEGGLASECEVVIQMENSSDKNIQKRVKIVDVVEIKTGQLCLAVLEKPLF